MLTAKQETAFKLTRLTLAGVIGSTCWRLADDVNAMKFASDARTLWLSADRSDFGFEVATGQRVDAPKLAARLQSSPTWVWQFEVRTAWRTGAKARHELKGGGWIRAITDAGRAVGYDQAQPFVCDFPSVVPRPLPKLAAAGKAAALSPDGAFALFEDVKHNVVLIELAHQRVAARWPKAKLLGFSPAAAFVVRGENVHVVPLNAPDSEQRVPCPGTDHCLSPDGALLACHRDQQIAVLDVATGEQRLSLDINATRYAFSPDGALLAVIDDYPDTPHEGIASGVVFLVDTATGATLAPRDEGHRGAVTGLAAPSGQPGLLVSIGDQSLRVWDRKGGHLIERVDELVGPDGLAVSADGKWAAIASRDEGSSLLVDLTSLEKHPLPEAAEDAVMDPNGETVALLSEDEMWLYSVPGRKPLSAGRRPEAVFAHDGLWAVQEGALWKWTGDGFAHQAPDVELDPLEWLEFAGISGDAVIYRPVGWDQKHVLAVPLKTGKAKKLFAFEGSQTVALNATHLAGVVAPWDARRGDAELVVHELSTGKEVGRARWPAVDGPASIAIEGHDVFVGTVLGRVLHFRFA